jgi:glycerophosphoryl diester phosphodiesterase
MDWIQFRQERKKRRYPFLIAHRGASAIAPENTLTSFSLASEQGADALETDLRFTKDDEIVLIHDATIDRTLNGSGLVRDFTLNELKRFRIKSPDGNESFDERVPTLRELVDATNAETPLLLELKDPLFEQRARAEQLARSLDELGVLSKSAIVSFHRKRILSVKEVCPTMPIGQINLRNPFPRWKDELQGPFWRLLLINPLYMTIARWWSSVVCALDLNSEERMDLYLRLRVDAVLVSDPARALKSVRLSGHGKS